MHSSTPTPHPHSLIFITCYLLQTSQLVTCSDREALYLTLDGTNPVGHQSTPRLMNLYYLHCGAARWYKRKHSPKRESHKVCSILDYRVNTDLFNQFKSLTCFSAPEFSVCVCFLFFFLSLHSLLCLFSFKLPFSIPTFFSLLSVTAASRTGAGLWYHLTRAKKKKIQIEKNRSTNSEVPSGRGNLK